MNENRKPSLWWLALSPMFVVVGLSIGTVFAVQMMDAMGSVPAFLVPSKQILTIKVPGRYILWHDYKGIFQGKDYDEPAALPDGATIVLSNELTAQEVAMDAVRSTSTSGRIMRVGLAQYTISTPGRYVLSVSGFDDERVLSFAQWYPDPLRRLAIRSNIASALGWLGALMVIVVVVVLRRENQKRIGQQSSGGDSQPAAGLERPQKQRSVRQNE